MDGVLECQVLALPHIAPQNPREGSVATRVRRSNAEMRHLTVGANHRERVAKNALHILLADDVVDSLTAAGALNFQQRLGRVFEAQGAAPLAGNIRQALSGELLIE